MQLWNAGAFPCGVRDAQCGWLWLPGPTSASRVLLVRRNPAEEKSRGAGKGRDNPKQLGAATMGRLGHREGLWGPPGVTQHPSK